MPVGMAWLGVVRVRRSICVVVLEAFLSKSACNGCITFCVHVRLGRGNANV